MPNDLQQPKRQIPPSPFSPEMLKEAVSTSHDNCTEGCIHAQSFGEAGEFMQQHIASLGLSALVDGDNPLEFIYYAAFHAGYRLSQLMHEPTPKGKVN